MRSQWVGGTEGPEDEWCLQQVALDSAGEMGQVWSWSSAGSLGCGLSPWGAGQEPSAYYSGMFSNLFLFSMGVI